MNLAPTVQREQFRVAREIPRVLHAPQDLSQLAAVIQYVRLVLLVRLALELVPVAATYALQENTLETI